MVIDRIHITGFGTLQNKDITFRSGLNIIEGENESGKTTVAAFLHFLLYGICDMEEMRRYFVVSDTISGYLDCTCTRSCRELAESAHTDITAEFSAAALETHSFRILRSYTLPGTEYDAPIHLCGIYPIVGGDAADTPVAPGSVPGEIFFGVTADVFRATALVQQITASSHRSPADSAGSYTGGAPLRSAIARILSTASEEIDPADTLARLTAQRNALFHPETECGSISTLERRRTALAASLTSSKAESIAEETPFISPEKEASIRKAIAEDEERIAEKQARIGQLQKLREKYNAYRAFDDADAIPDLRTRMTAAQNRAGALTKTMFRGSYIPDADYTASLHLCADDIRTAEQEEADARTALERLNFSIRRDNIKENQLAQVERDGGVSAITRRLDRLTGKRTGFTVCCVLFLLLTLLLLAGTAFMLVLHKESAQLAIILTAVLAALTALFFFLRARYERAVVSLLARYHCKTEDEFDNFLEEYQLSATKLQTLAQSKDDLSRRISEAGLKKSEALRQAAILLSRLQPADAQKLTAERVSVALIENAAARIDRTLTEIASLTEEADSCDRAIQKILTAHGARTEEEVLAQRSAAAVAFGGTRASDIDMEPILRELDFHIKSSAALAERISTLKAKLPKETPVQAQSETPECPIRHAKAADFTTDPRVTRALLAEIDEALRRQRKTYAALNLAIETLKSASEQMRCEIAPALTENAGRLMHILTDHSYSGLVLDDAMQLTAADRTDTERALASDTAALPVDYLSAGTQDLAYFSLRMSLLLMLYKKETPPMIFDEAFATLDNKRLTRMFTLLLRVSAPDADVTDGKAAAAQILVFTCHKRERLAAEAIRPCNIITL